MAKIKERRITEKMVKETIEDIKFFYGIILTELQVCYILLNYKRVRSDWNKIGDVDTVYREEFINALSIECGIKRGWPTANESDLVKKRFETRFKKGAAEKGYQLEGKWTMV